MVCWSSDVARTCVVEGEMVEGEMVVEVPVEATVVRVERGATAGVVDTVIAAVVGAADRAVTVVEFVAESGLLVGLSAHAIPAPVARTTRTSGTVKRRSRDRDRACRPL